MPAAIASQLPNSVLPLATEYGYLTSIGSRDSQQQGSGDVYHVDTVWPFEQALIHIGATRHSQIEVAEVAKRMAAATVRFSGGQWGLALACTGSCSVCHQVLGS